MQVELLNNNFEPFKTPRSGTVIQWGVQDSIVLEKGFVRIWATDQLTVKPTIDKGSLEETNRLLSTISDHLEIIAEELQEISGRIG